MSTKGRKQTSNCRPAHAMGFDCSKSVCQASSRCQAELDPEDSNEHSRQPQGGNTAGNPTAGGGGQNKKQSSSQYVCCGKGQERSGAGRDRASPKGIVCKMLETGWRGQVLR